MALRVKAYNEDNLVNTNIDKCKCEKVCTTHLILEDYGFMEVCDNCGKIIDSNIYKLEKGEKNEKN